MARRAIGAALNHRVEPPHLVRVIWISDTAPAGFTTDAGYFERHRQASMRFRVGIPSRALAALGVESGFIGLDTPAVLDHLAPEAVDAVVFAKLSTPRGAGFDAFTAAYLGTADHARMRGIRVVVDLVDNVFATDRRDFFLELLGRANAVTTATETLAEVCRHSARLPVHVVPDPVEGERRAPRFTPPRATLWSRLGLERSERRPLRLLWFGGQYRNFLDIAAFVPHLKDLATSRPVELTVMMNQDPRISRDLETFGKDAPDGFEALFSEWSLTALSDALDHCDLVLLPADLRDEARRTASANRMTRALWAGRGVVAHPLPAYLEFESGAVLNHDLRAALRWALDNAAEVEKRVAAGQEIVAARYGADAVARRWREVLASIQAH